MRNRVLLFVTALLICVSCSKDDDFAINSKNIVGHWQSVSYHGYTINLNTGEREDWAEKDYNGLSIKLYEDGTCLHGTVSKGTYQLLGNELDMYVSYYHSFLGYDINSKYNYTIESLTSDKMVLSIIEHGSSGGTDPIYYESHTTYTMKRVN